MNKLENKNKYKSSPKLFNYRTWGPKTLKFEGRKAVINSNSLNEKNLNAAKYHYIRTKEEKKNKRPIFTTTDEEYFRYQFQKALLKYNKKINSNLLTILDYLHIYYSNFVEKKKVCNKGYNQFKEAIEEVKPFLKKKYYILTGLFGNKGFIEIFGNINNNYIKAFSTYKNSINTHNNNINTNKYLKYNKTKDIKNIFIKLLDFYTKDYKNIYTSDIEIRDFEKYLSFFKNILIDLSLLNNNVNFYKSLKLEKSNDSNNLLNKIKSIDKNKIKYITSESEYKKLEPHLKILELNNFSFKNQPTLNQISKSFKKLSLIYNPNRGGNQEIFKKILESKNILKKYYEL